MLSFMLNRNSFTQSLCYGVDYHDDILNIVTLAAFSDAHVAQKLSESL